MLRSAVNRSAVRYNSNWASNLTAASADASGKPEKAAKKYIILGAKSSRLLPKRPPRAKVFAPTPKLEHGQVEEQWKKLMVFRTEASDKLVVDSIEAMKPVLDAVTNERLNQVRDQLNRSFTKAQLKSFLIKKNMHVTTKMTKVDFISIITEKIWKLVAMDGISGSSSDVLVENVINIDLKDMFLLLSHNGEVIRSWTKAGARVAVSSQNRQIRVTSTQETFDWINAVMHQKLSHVKEIEVPVTELLKFTKQGFQFPIGRIQFLSNAYIQFSKSQDYVTISALKSSDAQLAKRLLMHSALYQAINNEYIESAESKGSLRFADDDAMDWYERAQPWVRHQHPKQKKITLPVPTDESKLHSLTIDGKEATLDDTQLANWLTEQLTAKIASPPRGESTSLSIVSTFGFLLTDNQRGDRAFTTNIPNVAKVTQSLPYYSLDVADDESSTQSLSDLEALDGEERWRRLIESETFTDQSAKLKTSEIEELSHMVQLRFVPSPFESQQPTVAATPVEIWLELDDDQRAIRSSVKVVGVEQDLNLTVPLPTRPCDLRFNISQSVHLDKSPQPRIDLYLDSCNLDFSGEHRVHVAPQLTLEVDGVEVKYEYHELYHRYQREHRYNDQLMLVSTVEGGGVGGRRAEAQLVCDWADKSEFDKQHLSKMVQSALEFTTKLQ